ncbi:hypothetical protein HAV21_03335 [Paenarthrobacter sp. MSM-2-10-13]|uniref:hypothetical protein n=1 Tax=Paenarthrobacter sp. MSM-2-10-13 TaxID=2717318 RepID=UPI00141FB10D|nr:hypothetical protein [Paenarthrobacter sp. MSM-2-10-13]NHW45931.1 hypothetical protein [Paenarthrobacter sp. MSM-2-10-13]
MIRPDTRDHAIDIVVDRVSLMSPKELRALASQLPVGVSEAVEDFCHAVSLSQDERQLINKHNVSIPYELLELAKYKEMHGNNVTVELPPRNTK